VGCLRALLAASREDGPSAVLVDARATAADMATLTASLRCSEEKGPVVFLLTESAPLSLRSALFAAGAAGYVLLPLAEREVLTALRPWVEGPGATAAPPASPAEPAARDVHVLVADDDPLVRELLAFHLQREGWRTTLAADGEQARRALAAEEFDLAVMDLSMPFHSGLSLLGWIAQGEARSRPRTMLLSAHSNDETVLKAFALGASDFVSKPFSPLVVSSRLRRLVERPS
jgi:DNA-binding response OmpR family regulator